jgi:Cro/C1-type helix-turn-helix DNA-binding protein
MQLPRRANPIAVGGLKYQAHLGTTTEGLFLEAQGLAKCPLQVFGRLFVWAEDGAPPHRSAAQHPVSVLEQRQCRLPRDGSSPSPHLRIKALLAGITQEQLSLIEADKVDSRFSTILKLAEALGIEPGDLRAD